MALHPARKFARALCCAAVAFGTCLPAASAQNPTLDIKYSRQTRFVIPFEPEGAVQRLRQVELHCSTDQGRSWKFFGTANPNQRGFQFFAERDGIYWFTVRTVDIDGQGYPARLDGAPPQLVVCVDTQPPTVRLSPLAPQDGAGVGWEVRDEHLDLATLRLETRPPGVMTWTPVTVDPLAQGRWISHGSGQAHDEVRLQVRDKAGNLGEATTSLSGRKSDNRTYPPDSGTNHPGRPPVRLVNSTRININYRVEDVGPSKVTLELWWTRTDGRTWEKWPEAMPMQPPCVVQAPQEGLYGFTLVARSGVNLGDRPPQANEQPQIWVEVDLKEPQVQLTGVEVGRGQDANKMTIRWLARDKNLDDRPVKLEYASVTTEGGTERVGPWQEIAANLPAAGEHVWVVPTDGVLYHVRAVARDRANNIGNARTLKPVVVDLSRPRGIIIDVEPARGASGAGQPADPANTITLPSRGQ